MEYCYNLNNDYILRDRILFKNDIAWELELGGTKRFKCNLKDMLTLLENKFIDPKEKQNEAPRVKEFIKFMKKWTEYDIIAHGYAVSPHRTDYRVSIEGIEINSNEEFSSDIKKDIKNKFKEADEFQLTDKTFYCWYD